MANPFYGHSKADLETALSRVNEEIRSGRAVTSVDGDGGKFDFAIQMSPVERRRLILTELNRLDSVTYPAAMFRRIKNARAKFV